MFTKKFDYNDINNFLPSNKTIGTVDFFNKKFKNNMPEHICELLSIETLIENEEQKEKMKKEILNKKNEFTEKLLREYEDRKEEGRTEEDKKAEEVIIIETAKNKKNIKRKEKRILKFKAKKQEELILNNLDMIYDIYNENDEYLMINDIDVDEIYDKYLTLKINNLTINNE